ncbi:MAG: NAD(P)H-hydrate dehydratase [Candidatus Micrarchaeota archaeon]|nr:NAD(P)H-hydrate dehydratase [Candidatus Micrarchaeota archaeon]MDE1834185.1 NAD(P)H-hydrate dehydratase [Candidatus Micrarchaeota archaeon]MDE1859157.1 NAD(P)H-hydrate dehydratase [Candidatus Micrarchaeota archaeon]
MDGLALGKFSKYLAKKSDIRRASVPRKMFSNKYQNGRLLIIGGSSDYYGAPVMAMNSACQSLAALRVGAGYVKAFVPESILNTARALSPNAIISPSGKNEIAFGDAIKKAIDKSDVVLIGIGMGSRHANAIRKIVEYSVFNDKLVILDADAIPAARLVTGLGASQMLITPHDGEFSRLTNKKIPARSISERIEAAKAASNKYKTVVLLKGHNTIVTDGTLVKIIQARSAALATMGTGDVLSGIIGGYASRCKDLFAAAVAGAYVHSKIGDLLHKKKGDHILATDIIDMLPDVLKDLDR